MSIQRIGIVDRDSSDYAISVWLISHALWSFEVTPQIFMAVVLSLRAAKIISPEQAAKADELLETILDSFDPPEAEDENGEE